MEVQVNDKLVLAENTHLETERLVLRPVVMKDAAAMYAYAQDAEMTRYVFPTHQSLKDTKISIATIFMADPLGKFAIELKENQQMIGTIELRVNISAGTAELGYALSRDYWGQGIIPEAAKRLLRLAFEELRLIRVWAIHDLRNLSSGRVMQKIGMTHESTVKQAQKIKGEVVDIATYSITQQAWLAKMKERSDTK